MTTGSPVASAVSGPGCADTKAIRFPSGDHEGMVWEPGSGAFVPIVSASSLAPVPSGRATTTPCLPPTDPEYAIHWPSGDHTGPPDGSLSPPNLTVRPSAIVMTHSCPYGRPAPSLFSTT